MTEEWEWKEFAEFARAKQELQDAEHRVAEAALNLGSDSKEIQRNISRWFAPAEMFSAALDDLRRLMEGK